MQPPDPQSLPQIHPPIVLCTCPLSKVMHTERKCRACAVRLPGKACPESCTFPDTGVQTISVLGIRHQCLRTVFESWVFGDELREEQCMLASAQGESSRRLPLRNDGNQRLAASWMVSSGTYK